MKYEDLLIEADNNHLIAKEKPLPISKGRIKGNKIALRKGMSATEKKCVLAEELGHHYTTVGNIMDLTKVENRKQERRARIWAYNKMISLSDLVNCYHSGCKNQYEIAEYLDVTEEFLIECLTYFREKYGLYAKQDNYLIYFEPLGILDVYK